jgi:S-adenosylmethionine-diacylgycerolhomoserine-N-methlytransferase
MSALASTNTTAPLAGYYRWHAAFYDLTRWAFLFGRRPLILLAAAQTTPQRILEIGCGTGRNLAELADCFPKAQIVGVDLSKDMLDRARPKLRKYGRRVALLHRAYDAPVAVGTKFDLIVFSYSLSMMNPGFEKVLEFCQADLSEHGAVAVVDFHDTSRAWFRRWMGVNHVRMEGQILATLREHFTAICCQEREAYAGMWRFLVFVGRAQSTCRARQATVVQQQCRQSATACADVDASV